MTSSFGRWASRATILRASSNGHACDCSASSRKLGDVSIAAVGIDAAFRFLRLSERADGEIAEPKVRVAALFPLAEQRPIERLAQHIVAALDGDADAFA